MHVIADTETNGKWDKKLPIEHPSQPHMVQLAAILADDEGREHGYFKAVCKLPPGVTIAAEAESKHGISLEMTERVGVLPVVALAMLIHFMKRAKYFVAFNAAFDSQVIR